MPGVNQRAMDKARSLNCDAVILDLEDAVAPGEKDGARSLVCAQVESGGYGHREVVIRVNGETTPWHEDDMRAAFEAGPDAVLVPKVQGARMAQRCVERIQVGGPSAPALWVMIETPDGVAAVESIAAVEGVEVLVMGTSDLLKELRADRAPDRSPLLYGLSRSVFAARQYGLDILDGVVLDLRDATAFEAECGQGRALGFDGKTLIHPNQIAGANAAFGPAIDAVEHARRVLAAWEGAEADGRGVAVLDGSMIENLHAEQARRVVAFAEALANRDG